LTLDDAKLAHALASDPTGVSNLFALVQNGIGKRIPDTIDSFINPIGGSLITRQQGMQNDIDRIDQKVAREETRITALQDRLTKQFSTLEQMVSQLKSQGDYLTQQLSALSTQINYKQK
jgi:flagellar hook-associated protein 2